MNAKELYDQMEPRISAAIGALEDLRDSLCHAAHPNCFTDPNPHPPGTLEYKLWDEARGIVRVVEMKESPWVKLMPAGE